MASPVGGFRIIVCMSPNTDHLKNSFGNRIPFSRPTFERLVQTFSFPKAFLELIAGSGSGVFANFQSGDNEPPGTGVVIQTPDCSILVVAPKMSLVLFRNDLTATVTGPLHYHARRENIANQFLELVRNEPDRASDLWYLCTTFLKAHHNLVEKFRQRLIRSMHEIGGEMNALDREIRKSEEERVEVDIVITDIKYFWFELTAMKSRAVFERRLCYAISEELALSKVPSYLRVIESLEALKWQIEGCIESCSSLEMRIGARNTTLYNRVSGDASRLNYQVTKAARRDSHDMRAIGIIATVFLPRSFVAALYGVGIFSTNSNSSQLTSKPMIVYWVTTISLTVIVCVTWLHLSQRYRDREKTKDIEASWRR
ncbi:hypothetical protein K440DRAFT_661555 [Wilcoxina mikolae CBS 423.85]|nr:hypothetical protein K440DRAFT_661555 [Wilcoxina mikolae CBS 423.85]